MKRLRLPDLAVLALGILGPLPLSGQQPIKPLPTGTWSGHLTPMNHPEQQTPLQFLVSEEAGEISIDIRGPEDLHLVAEYVEPTPTGLDFTFIEPEADTPLRCRLRFDEDDSLSGRCADLSGKWATLVMTPPGDPGEGEPRTPPSPPAEGSSDW